MTDENLIRLDEREWCISTIIDQFTTEIDSDTLDRLIDTLRRG